MKNSRLCVFQILNSSLWITVLVVRVGCIIEAHPSSINNSDQEHSNNVVAKLPHNLQPDPVDLQETSELETAASQSFVSSQRNVLLRSSSGPDSILAKKESSNFQLKEKQASFGDYNDDKTVGATSSSTPRLAVSSKRIKNEFLLETTTTTRASGDTTTLATTTGPANEINDRDDTNKSLVSSGEEEGAASDDDSCSGKADGYYQNFGSFCTSYYFCAAGYQITYVCPIGTKFSGKRCEKGYECPMTTANGHHIGNDCENKSNGYYPSNNNKKSSYNGPVIGKYFYCYQQAKVIELQCDAGKIFVKDKCIFHDEDTASLTARLNQHKVASHENGEEVNRDLVRTSISCEAKSNGFYQDLDSNCEWYYYCIGGEKRELRCQEEYIFNGDICVHKSRYECPIPHTSEGSGPVRNRRSFSTGAAETERKTKLPIISNPLFLRNEKITAISSPENNYSAYSGAVRAHSRNNVVAKQSGSIEPNVS